MEPGRVDQHVEAAEAGHALLDGVTAGLRAGDVHRGERPPGTGFEDRRHPFGVAAMPNTCAPRSANNCATAAPSPDDAPVTRATLPVSCAICGSFRSSGVNVAQAPRIAQPRAVVAADAARAVIATGAPEAADTAPARETCHTADTFTYPHTEGGHHTGAHAHASTVATDPATPMLPVVAIDPATAMLPAVAIDPATAMLPEVATAPATAMLAMVASDPRPRRCRW